MDPIKSFKMNQTDNGEQHRFLSLAWNKRVSIQVVQHPIRQ